MSETPLVIIVTTDRVLKYAFFTTPQDTARGLRAEGFNLEGLTLRHYLLYGREDVPGQPNKYLTTAGFVGTRLFGGAYINNNSEVRLSDITDSNQRFLEVLNMYLKDEYCVGLPRWALAGPESYVTVKDAFEGMMYKVKDLQRVHLAPVADNKNFDLRHNVANLVREALEHTNWNKKKAAELLGISRETLYRKIKEYGIRQSPD